MASAAAVASRGESPRIAVIRHAVTSAATASAASDITIARGSEDDIIVIELNNLDPGRYIFLLSCLCILLHVHSASLLELVNLLISLPQLCMPVNLNGVIL